MLAVKFGEISRRDRPNREIPRKHFLIRFWLNAKFLQISRFTARVEIVLEKLFTVFFFPNCIAALTQFSTTVNRVRPATSIFYGQRVLYVAY